MSTKVIDFKASNYMVVLSVLDNNVKKYMQVMRETGMSHILVYNVLNELVRRELVIKEQGGFKLTQEGIVVKDLTLSLMNKYKIDLLNQCKEKIIDLERSAMKSAGKTEEEIENILKQEGEIK